MTRDSVTEARSGETPSRLDPKGKGAGARSAIAQAKSLI
jgi:hypothetical protein